MPASNDLPDPSVRTPPVVPDYALLCSIGRGHFGEVWLARNALGAFRAVKVVHRAGFDDPADYDREFAGVRHFEPISREHPGLVDLLDVGVNEAEGFFYYAMELADDARGGNRSGGVVENWNDAPAAASHHSNTPALQDPARYSPLTLSARLRAQGRLPLAECLRLGISLADALEFLHARGLIHRDIKPDNIIFVGGVPKLADVGTVTHVSEAKTMVGTRGFEAPEGAGKPQADLYSLGKVLYEISTGKDRQRFPEPLTKLADLPDRERWQEFNAVVDKACQPEPTRRYPSTTELHADLLDIQRGRSVKKRWMREKRFKQVLLVSAGMAVLAAIASALYVQQFRLRIATERTAKAEQATLSARLKGEEDQRMEAEKGRALLELEKAIRPPHTAGWSSNAWFIASNAAVQFGFDTNLQSQAAASLAGLDAHCLFQTTNGIGGSSVAFSLDGKWVLYGSLSKSNQTTEPGFAHLLDLTTTNLTAFPVPGEGPVAFLPNGTPVQFSSDTNHQLALWAGPPNNRRADVPSAFDATRGDNAQSGQDVRAPEATAQRYFALPNGEILANLGALAMTPDGAFVAASGTTTSNRTLCAVWSGTNGDLLFPLAASLASAANSPPEEQRHSLGQPLRSPATNALALTPDGSLVAAGNDDGQVFVWRIPGRDGFHSVPNPTGKDGDAVERVPTNAWKIPAGRLPIRSLAFCRDYVRDPLHPAPEPQWLLAIGDQGGQVIVWSLRKGGPLSICSGNYYEVRALAFSPDGTILASAGRGQALLWDWVRCSISLRIVAGDFHTGLAFSTNGRRLAVCGTGGFTYHGQSHVLAVSQGRGLSSLAGLSQPVSTACISPDGTLVAGLASNWQLGLWERATAKLLLLFDVPPGISADNAALRFGPDNRRLFYGCTGGAWLWDVQTREVLGHWLLQPGLCDQLAFQASGRVLLGRAERLRKSRWPAVKEDYATNPWVYRVRELTPPDQVAPVTEITNFNGGIEAVALAVDGHVLFLGGKSGRNGNMTAAYAAFNPLSGNLLWQVPAVPTNSLSSVFLDPGGLHAAVSTNTQEWSLLNLGNRSLRALPTIGVGAVGPGGRRLAGVVANEPAERLTIFEMQGGTFGTPLRLDATSVSMFSQFDASGQFLIWSTAGGGFQACDLDEIVRQLHAIKLWR